MKDLCLGKLEEGNHFNSLIKRKATVLSPQLVPTLFKKLE